MIKLSSIFNKNNKTNNKKIDKNPKEKPKEKSKSYKCVEFKTLAVNGEGDTLKGIILRTITVENTYPIYVVLVYNVNDENIFSHTYIKYISKYYCTPTNITKTDFNKIPKYKLKKK